MLQESVAGFETEIKALFAKHPEWRGDTKSVKTPYGSVEQRSSKSLVAPNPTMTVALIEAKGKVDANFKPETFLHITKEPNLETLEAWSDDELAKVGINREENESVTVKPARINVAKTVKAAKAKTSTVS